MFTKLENLLDSFLAQGIPGYDCIVYHKGKEVFRRFGGYSSLEEKIPTNGKEQYFIYSCSKPITAAAGLICLERGLFSLDDHICKYLPEFTDMTVMDGDTPRPAEKKITVKDLFCMTGGFSYNAHSPQLCRCIEETGGDSDTKTVMTYLAKEPLLFEPGARWEYSFCHDVLAALIERASGTRFSTFVKENIFDPLGMNSSTFLIPENTDNIADHFMYHPDTKVLENFGRKLLDFSEFGRNYESGGGGCLSSAEDCIRFLEELRCGETILKHSTVELMTTNMLNDDQMKTYWMPGYGYGLGVKCSIGKENCTDFGWGGMAGALMSVDPEKELSIYYVQHVLLAPNDIGRYMIPSLVHEALGLSSAAPKSALSEPNIYV